MLQELRQNSRALEKSSPADRCGRERQFCDKQACFRTLLATMTEIFGNKSRMFDGTKPACSGFSSLGIFPFAASTMVSGFRSLFQPRPIAEELRRQSRVLLLGRMRTGIVLALFFIPSFIPLDYFRMPEHFAWAIVVRLFGCGLLLILLPILSPKSAAPWAEWLGAV